MFRLSYKLPCFLFSIVRVTKRAINRAKRVSACVHRGVRGVGECVACMHPCVGCGAGQCVDGD